MSQKISTKLLIAAIAILAFVAIFLVWQSEKKNSELISQQKTQATQLGELRYENTTEKNCPPSEMLWIRESKECKIST